MAQAPGQGISALARGFVSLRNAQKVGLLLALAAVIALVVVAVIWARAPEYRVLYSNLSDREGGEVLAALSQQNVPYRVAEGGRVILVPAERVYELRLSLAAQGLPKGGAVGFELMDTQRFGISQHAEQVNYQRALAGELSRTIQSLAVVQAARVHLAIPRPSVFVRERQLPSASVLVSLYPGRSVDEGQVDAIQHLVASSVPELPARNVTVVDQSGNLLSGTAAASGVGGLDASQLKYLHAVEASYAARIESILAPILGGAENVRAQVTATLDFNQVEQTSETFKPNARVEATVRSQSTVETVTQPQRAAAQAPASTRRESVVNYEVDKTIRYTKGEVGAVKRVSAAVVVNYRRETDQTGKMTFQPLSEEELAHVTALARQALGFSEERGDTLSVVNAPFSVAGLAAPVEAQTPAWDAFLRQLASPQVVQALKHIGLAILLVLVFFGLIRLVRDLIRAGQARPGAPAGGPAEPQPAGAAAYAPAAEMGLEAELQAVKDLARQEPRVVASVIKRWLGRE
jgi:flagellar M-ring protein FliF